MQRVWGKCSFHHCHGTFLEHAVVIQITAQTAQRRTTRQPSWQRPTSPGTVERQARKTWGHQALGSWRMERPHRSEGASSEGKHPLSQPSDSSRQRTLHKGRVREPSTRDRLGNRIQGKDYCWKHFCRNNWTQGILLLEGLHESSGLHTASLHCDELQHQQTRTPASQRRRWQFSEKKKAVAVSIRYSSSVC